MGDTLNKQTFSKNCVARTFESKKESATSVYDSILTHRQVLEKAIQEQKAESAEKKEMQTFAKTEKQLINTELEAIEIGTLVDPEEEKSPEDKEKLEILDPDVDPIRLASVVEESNVLKQCISSYVVNIDSYGSVLEYIGAEGKRGKPKNTKELAKARALIDCPSPTTGMSLIEIRKRFRQDLETYGNAYLEVSRRANGEVTSIDHISAETMRITKTGHRLVNTTLTVLNPDTGKIEKRSVRRRFRRYVQEDPTNLERKIYFKEYGDPRKIDPATGYENNKLKVEDCATEVIHYSIYTPGRVYGNPRWLGVLPCLLGSRESELVNLNFFRDNAIPAMAVLISGGALTEESFQMIQKYMTAVRGKDAMNRVMVLEASSDDSNADLTHSQPAPKIEMKPMISERQQDGLFKEYDDFNMLKIRSSFRLSPLHIGRSDDYNKASAAVAMQVVESQVFLPERNAFDDMFNSRIFSTLNINNWRYRSMGPTITDAGDISTLLKTVGAEGALTPNTVIAITNKLFDLKIEPVDQEWGDYPYSMIRDYISRGVVIKGVDEFMEKINGAISVLGKDPRGGANNVNTPSTAAVAVSANPSSEATADPTEPQENNENKKETLDNIDENSVKYIVADTIRTLNNDIKGELETYSEK